MEHYFFSHLRQLQEWTIIFICIWTLRSAPDFKDHYFFSRSLLDLSTIFLQNLDDFKDHYFFSHPRLLDFRTIIFFRTRAFGIFGPLFFFAFALLDFRTIIFFCVRLLKFGGKLWTIIFFRVLK